MPVFKIKRIKSRRGKLVRLEAANSRDFMPKTTPEEEARAYREAKEELRRGVSAPEPGPAPEAAPPPPETGAFACPDCGFTATTKQGLGAHRRAKHKA